MRNLKADGGVRSAGPILMDADTGVDDALALALLLGAARGRLIGVVATYGNVAQSQAERNTRDVLRLLGADAVPVYAGSRAPSWADCFVPDAACAHFHGSNGLGGLDVDDYLSAGAPVAVQRTAHLRAAMKHAGEALPDPALVHSADATARATRTTVVSYGGYLPAHGASTIPTTAETAGDGGGVDAIIAAARRWGGDLTLVTTGPLTDAAEAIRRAPEIARNLRIVAMGGAFLQQGNCYDLTSETNIIQDPEAADFVVRSGADVTLVGLDATHRCLCMPAMRDAVRSAGTAQADFLADIMSVMIEANASVDPQFTLGAPLHDPLAAAVALDPTLVRTIDLPMKVQLATGDGHGVRGRTVGDPMGLARLVAEDGVARAHVAVDADSGRFAENFLAALITVHQYCA
ncbi:nucleoside hydrolase [Pseudoscardovia suis]|uniref:nucleoside hydrolase n=1 Tax=Pseudoscardovia suis TaxID=987063 RepID=UPI003F997F0B